MRQCVKHKKRIRVPLDLRSVRHVPRRRVRSRGVGAGVRPDQQAAMDLRLLEAVDGSRHPRLRHERGPRLHAVPPVQLDRRRPRSVSTPRRKVQSRVITQFLGHIVRGETIKLVDGGQQKRAFTYVDDGIAALMRIIENPAGRATRQDLQYRQPGQQFFDSRAGRDDAGAGRRIRRIPRQRGEGEAGRRQLRMTTTAAATRTCRTACRRSRTPRPT